MADRSSSRRVPVPALVVLVLGLVVAGVALVAGAAGGDDDDGERKLGATTLPPGFDGRKAPQFRLDAARGDTIDTARLRGRPYLVTFLYTRCPDVCPVIGQDIKDALGQLGERAREVTAVAVSVDPRGDRPAAVREWLRRQRLPDQFRYAVGSRSELEPVWRAYMSAPQLPDKPETSTHSAAIWLVDRDGRWRGRFPAGSPIEPTELARDLEALLDEPA